MTSDNSRVEFAIILGIISLIALIVAVIMRVRRDPEAAETWGEARVMVQDSYTAFRNKELRDIDGDIDDVSLGEFFVPENKRRNK